MPVRFEVRPGDNSEGSSATDAVLPIPHSAATTVRPSGARRIVSSSVVRTSSKERGSTLAGVESTTGTSTAAATPGHFSTSSGNPVIGPPEAQRSMVVRAPVSRSEVRASAPVGLRDPAACLMAELVRSWVEGCRVITGEGSDDARRLWSPAGHFSVARRSLLSATASYAKAMSIFDASAPAVPGGRPLILSNREKLAPATAMHISPGLWSTMGRFLSPEGHLFRRPTPPPSATTADML
jgi:hypothetical protein